MGKEGDPVFKRLKINEDPATVLFHFRRSPEGTRYFPTIKLNGVRIEFMFKEAEIITSSPAFMLLGAQLLQFDQELVYCTTHRKAPCICRRISNYYRAI